MLSAFLNLLPNGGMMFGSRKSMCARRDKYFACIPAGPTLKLSFEHHLTNCFFNRTRRRRSAHLMGMKTHCKTASRWPSRFVSLSFAQIQLLDFPFLYQ
ncbi:hypothetical protein EJ08DRAFT_221067 [Tothia fuscella]|uniref:Uncharacterized protein n=1 Tax=Tothia fuscella TaxID=1048955 RepID=A0A9P4U4F1_9PEZI|nr:hypothetical protein EJ08DRAFT_221067 [Tothia fuscella]